MYQAYFGFREKPFNLTPDPRFLYLNASYREALAALHYAIAERKGFASLVGEAGTGKTTLLRRLLAELTPDTRSVLVLNPAVGFEELLRFILTDLGRPPAAGTPKLEMLEALNAELLDTLARGGNVAVLIDEAQDLTIPVLEELRLLSNLETAKEKILQFVLAGQPELETMLARPEIRQLRQRIAVRARLRPLARSELRAYVAARIAAAGGDERGLFGATGLYRLWRFSRGVPRLVNVACDNALVTAYAAGRRSVGWREIGEAVRDLEPGARGAARRPFARVRLGTIFVAAVLGVAVGLVASRLVGSAVTRGAADPAGRETAGGPVREAVPAREAAAAADPSAAATDPAIESVAGAETLLGDTARAGGEPAPAVGDAGAPREGAGPAVSTAGADEAGETARAGPREVREGGAGEAPPAGGESFPVAEARVPEGGAIVAALAPAAERRDLEVRVERGDTLTAIAIQHYGYVTRELLDEIKQANSSIEDLDVIIVGRTLVLPRADGMAPGARTPPILAAPE
jgi:general secretion pathway protein A